MLVLIADEDADRATALRFAFDRWGHSVIPLIGDSIAEAIPVARELAVDVVVVGGDVQPKAVIALRGQSGVFTGAIIVVAWLPRAEDRVAMLEAGADDVVCTPFHGDEVVARANAVARRYAGHAEANVEVGALVVSLGMDPITIGGKEVHLSTSERRIVQFLALRKGRVVSKEQIYDRLYAAARGDGPEIKIIDVLICKTRQRLSAASGGQNWIETEWGVGYRLRDSEGCKPPLRRRSAETAVADLEAARAEALVALLALGRFARPKSFC